MKANGQTSVTSSFIYDPIYELTQVTQPAVNALGNLVTKTVERYIYDAVGNRLGGGTVTHAYDNSNELLSKPNTAFTYDNNGNTLTKAVTTTTLLGTTTTATTTYAWDFENRLASVTNPNGTVVSFKYDPFGRRIQKNTHSYVYDGSGILEEINNTTGAVTSRFTQGAGIDEPLAVQNNAGTFFYEADGLGSITSLSDPTGTVVETNEYDSFGKEITHTGIVVHPYRYTAREWDSDTGLYYYRARYYEPQNGRFLSEDPIGFDGGENFYDYANNNPISFVDSSGLRIDYGSYVLSNPLVRSNFDLLNSLIVQSGISDDCFVLRVTGGDRYRDAKNPQIIRSATNNAVVKNADPHSPHLTERGARAVDFVIQSNGDGCKCKPVTNALVDKLLIMTDFSAVNTRRNYSEGPHTHINLPNLPKYYGER